MILNSWNQIVTQNESKVYHLYEWGTLLNRVLKQQLIYLEENESVFPLVYVRSLLFGNRLISLPFADYGGPCSSNMIDASKLIEKSIRIGKDLAVDYIEIRAPNAIYGETLKSYGFNERYDYFTYILNLEYTIDELWNVIGSKNRNMVRKAKKMGIQVVCGQNKSDLIHFYDMYLHTMKRLGSPPHAYAFFEAMWDLFYPNNILVLIAKLNDQYLSGSIFLLYNDTIHHAYSCMSERSCNFGQNNLILWEGIKFGISHGFGFLDFGRTRENAGNVLFKRRWGGELVKLPYYYISFGKEIPVRDEIKYKQLSLIWRRFIPNLICNELGPHIIRQLG